MSDTTEDPQRISVDFQKKKTIIWNAPKEIIEWITDMVCIGKEIKKNKRYASLSARRGNEGEADE